MINWFRKRREQRETIEILKASKLYRLKDGENYLITIGSLTTNPPLLPSQKQVNKMGKILSKKYSNVTLVITGPDLKIKPIKSKLNKRRKND